MSAESDDARAATRGAGVVRRLERLAELFAAVLFGSVVVVFGANIVGRYVFSRPIIWADELVVVLIIWSTFLTAAFVVREREHVAVDLLYEHVAPQRRRAMLIAGSFVLLAIFGAALPGIVGYTSFLWRERTAVLELRLDVLYACFTIFIAAVVVRRFLMLIRLVRSRWEDELRKLDHEPAAASEEARVP
jgi:TRAP-type C4-dicarboxylate transport system permease small subunit